MIEEDDKLLELNRKKHLWRPPLYRELPPDKDGIFTLRGPRQIGKTTLIKTLIRKLLLERKHPKQCVFFFPCDRVRDYEELYGLLREYLNYARPRAPERLFIFLDEISFVKEWPRGIKALADEGMLKNATLILTGSNTLDLLFSGERLPGRRGEWLFPDLTLLPLSFDEYVGLLNPELSAISEKEACIRHLPDMEKLFGDYLITGGFPCAINDFAEKGFIPAYRYDVYLKWIEGDLHKIGKSEDIAYRLLANVMESLSSTLSWYNLARRSGIVSHTTAESYVRAMEKMFALIIAPHFPLHVPREDFRKNKKIYFCDPFIFHAFRAKIDGFLDEAFSYSRGFLGSSECASRLVENVVASHLSRTFQKVGYWQGKNREVDFLGWKKKKASCFEVKYKNNVAPSEFGWTKQTLDGKSLTVITKRDSWSKETALAAPACIFLAYPAAAGPG